MVRLQQALRRGFCPSFFILLDLRGRRALIMPPTEIIDFREAILAFWTKMARRI
jgi:hypothetical protein